MAFWVGCLRLQMRRLYRRMFHTSKRFRKRKRNEYEAMGRIGRIEDRTRGGTAGQTAGSESAVSHSTWTCLDPTTCRQPDAAIVSHTTAGGPAERKNRARSPATQPKESAVGGAAYSEPTRGFGRSIARKLQLLLVALLRAAAHKSRKGITEVSGRHVRGSHLEGACLGEGQPRAGGGCA